MTTWVQEEQTYPGEVIRADALTIRMNTHGPLRLVVVADTPEEIVRLRKATEHLLSPKPELNIGDML